jgi:hypothetical protein
MIFLDIGIRFRHTGHYMDDVVKLLFLILLFICFEKPILFVMQ